MNVQLTHLYYLLLLAPALGWVVWLAWKTEVQIGTWRRWLALGIRCVVVLSVVLALAGLQWLLPVEGMNLFFVLDRSESIPAGQQETAREYVNHTAKLKENIDKAGVIVFGSEASIESTPNAAVDLQKVQAVVGTERTDLGAAIRLGTAAFPETGQKRLVLLTDGNENLGDAMNAAISARPLGVSIDVLPLGVARPNDLFVQKVELPSRVNEGQPFDAKIFVQTEKAQEATVRLYRNEQFLGEQKVGLAAGKNLFSFPQTLRDAGFYSYDVRVEAAGDPVPQNNRAFAFTSVSGKSRILVISSDPDQDRALASALGSTSVEVKLIGVQDFPGTLAELQSYEAIFISNVAAGDLGTDRQKLLESAVRDFGVGLVCVGGDQAYAAGGYRNTPLETTLPVNMELDSKKVLPSGAVVLVMHGMEFDNGNAVARQCAQGVLDALGPGDELGVVLWDGRTSERWLFPLQKVGNKKDLREQIAGMHQGDLGSFQHILEMAQTDLKKSKANLKHIIVFSDGDPARPTEELLQSIVADRITLSTVLIAGHAGPDTMIFMAEKGKGRFYDVKSPNDLPQIFIKETAVILKSAIYEEPFKPQVRAITEPILGISPGDYPTLLGYVATTPKARAETPLWTDKGDPLLAHWQYGLGRAVAFTSDAKARWGKQWLNWSRYRQFWSQIGQWSLRKLVNTAFTTDVSIEKGAGLLQVEALSSQGDYINFLNLQATVVSPTGDRQTLRLEQTGPGHYQVRFPTKEVGAYTINLMEIKDGKLRGSQVIGTSVNYSPEFNVSGPNLNLLRRIAENTGGKLLDGSAMNPFAHDRKKTFQPVDLWPWLLKLAIVLFVLDVGVRRIQIDREEWVRLLQRARRLVFFWRGVPRPVEAEISLAALLARRDQVRSSQTAPATEVRPELFQPSQPVPAPDLKASEPGPGVETTAEPKAEVEPSKHGTEPQSTASRLLEAKRRAQRRK